MVHPSKCSKVFITKGFEGVMQDTGEITLGKGKIVDFPGQVHLITELTLQGVGVVISKIFSGQPVAEVAVVARLTQAMSHINRDSRRVLRNYHNNKLSINRPPCLTMMIIPFDHPKICKLKTKVVKTMKPKAEYLQVARRCCLHHVKQGVRRQRRVRSLALLSKRRLRLPLQPSQYPI